MDAITLRPLTTNTSQRTLPIPHRWFYVLALHMAGKSCREIAQQTRYTTNYVYRILQHPDIVALRSRLLDFATREFEALWPTVVENIRNQLASEDPRVQLAAQHQWLKASGKYAASEHTEKPASAEDVVAKLLQVNVQVNVDKRQ